MNKARAGASGVTLDHDVSGIGKSDSGGFHGKL